MCGKFTAQASWREVVDFSQPLTVDSGGGDSGGDEGAAGETITYRVGGNCRSSSGTPEKSASAWSRCGGPFPTATGRRSTSTLEPRRSTGCRPSGSPSLMGGAASSSSRHSTSGRISAGLTARRWPAVDDRPDRRPAARLLLHLHAGRSAELASAHLGVRDGYGAGERADPAHDQGGRGRPSHAGHTGGVIRRMGDLARRGRQRPRRGESPAQDGRRGEVADVPGAEGAETAAQALERRSPLQQIGRRWLGRRRRGGSLDGYSGLGGYLLLWQRWNHYAWFVRAHSMMYSIRWATIHGVHVEGKIAEMFACLHRIALEKGATG